MKMIVSLIALLIFSGCAIIPIGSKEPEGMTATLESFSVGDDKEEVEFKIQNGIFLSYFLIEYLDESESHVIWTARGDEYQAFWFMYAPIAFSKEQIGKLYCIGVTFDANDKFVSYKTGKYSDNIYTSQVEDDECKFKLFTYDQISSFEIGRVPKL